MSVHPDDPQAKENFVQLGRTFESLQKRLAEGKLREGNGLDVENGGEKEEDGGDEYGEDEVRPSRLVSVR